MGEYELIMKTQIEGDFTGFDDGMIFEFTDGSCWLQSDYRYWYHYAYRPHVNFLRKGGRLYLHLEGTDRAIAVSQVTDVIKSQVNGDFKGWDGETIY